MFLLILKFVFMKRLGKIKVSSSLLSKKELKELKGGDDVYNTNSVGGCNCSFKNLSAGATYNGNSVDGCRCTCF